jgi:hypothetical protein
MGHGVRKGAKYGWRDTDVVAFYLGIIPRKEMTGLVQISLRESWFEV